ncbi:MAG: hypothetical protein ACK49D_04295 [Flavobacteriia bacterium]|jgi:hypothetical protein|nr:hypothetical protein [Cryomorphaceae bacterium]
MSRLIHKKFALPLILFCLCGWIGTANAQSQYLRRKNDPYKWMFGLGWNVIDDDGLAFSNLLDYQNSWNYLYYPTTLSIDKYFKKGWSIDGAISYNSYSTNKLINDSTGVKGIFAAADLSIKYSFLPRMAYYADWLDMYLAVGIGMTYRQTMLTPLTPMTSLTLGANLWFSKHWGFRLQTCGKIGLVSDIWASNTDYIQHTIGIVYRMKPVYKSNFSNKRQYKWTRKKHNYRRRNNG